MILLMPRGIVHHQGSLLISKLEFFFIKADFRGLVFFYKLGPIQFFLYNEGSFFYKRVHILFISIIFEAKTVILPFFISLTIGC